MRPSPAPRRHWLRKTLAILGRSVGVLFLLVGFAVIIREQIPWTFAAPGADERWLRITLTAITLLALWLGLRHCFRRPRLTGRALTCFAISAVSGWIWLTWDDPKLDFPPENHLTSADFPEAQATNDLVLRYRPGGESPLPKDLPDLREPSSRKANVAPTTEQWKTFLTKNRADIEQGWEQLADRRAWIAEMAAAPRLADLMTSISDPILSFRDLRATGRFMTWHARLIALDGHGDEALVEIGTLLETSLKLPVESRTLVRSMIAIVLQKMALHSANFVLDNTEASSEARTRLLTILRARQNPATGAENLLWCEYPLGAQAMLENQELNPNNAFGINHLNALQNRRTTVNIYAHILREMAEHSGRRELDAIRDIQHSLVQPTDDLRLKNLPGRLLITLVIPAFSKISTEYWKNEDLCTALEQRLQTD